MLLEYLAFAQYSVAYVWLPTGCPFPRMGSDSPGTQSGDPGVLSFITGVMDLWLGLNRAFPALETPVGVPHLTGPCVSMGHQV